VNVTTGGANVVQLALQVISSTDTNPTMSTVVATSASAVPADHAGLSYTLTAKDRTGNPTGVGGLSWTAKAILQLPRVRGSATGGASEITGTVVDATPAGDYDITFPAGQGGVTKWATGTYFIEVRGFGALVSGSPFTLTVTAGATANGELVASADGSAWLPFTRKAGSSAALRIATVDINGNRRDVSDADSALEVEVQRQEYGNGAAPWVTVETKLAVPGQAAQVTATQATHEVVVGGVLHGQYKLLLKVGSTLPAVGAAAVGSVLDTQQFTLDPLPPPVPAVLKFHNTGAMLELVFTVATNRGGAAFAQDCANVIQFAAGKLGTGALCRWRDDRTLRILTGEGATIVPGETGTIQSGVITTAAGNSLFAQSRTVPLFFPDQPPVPVAVIEAPTEVGVCDKMALSAAASTGGASRALTYSWAFSPPVAGIASGASDLEISELGLVFDTSYNATLVVTNFLNTRSPVARHAFAKSSLPKPTVTIRSAQPLQVRRWQPTRIYVGIQTSSCMQSLNLTKQWSQSGGTPLLNLSGVRLDSRDLFLPANTLGAPGSRAVFDLAVAYAVQPSASTTSHVEVEVVGTEPHLSISGGARSVKTSDSVRLSAGLTDPDQWGDVASQTFTWSCAVVEAVVSSSGTGSSSGGAPACNAAVLNALAATSASTVSLQAADIGLGSYAFSVAVTFHGFGVSAESVVEVVLGAPPKVSMAPVTGLVNVANALALSAEAEARDNTTSITNVSWVVEKGVFDLGKSGNLKTALNELDVVVAADPTWSSSLLLSEFSLVPGATYVFKATFTASDGATAFATSTFTTRQAPFGGSIRVAPPRGGQVVTTFTATAPRWTPDIGAGPLSYQFLWCPNGTCLALTGVQSSNRAQFLIPDADDATKIGVVVFDAFGAKAASEYVIDVDSVNIVDKAAVVSDMLARMDVAIAEGDFSKVLQLTTVGSRFIETNSSSTRRRRQTQQQQQPSQPSSQQQQQEEEITQKVQKGTQQTHVDESTASQATQTLESATSSSMAGTTQATSVALLSQLLAVNDYDSTSNAVDVLSVSAKVLSSWRRDVASGASSDTTMGPSVAAALRQLRDLELASLSVCGQFPQSYLSRDGSLSLSTAAVSASQPGRGASVTGLYSSTTLPASLPGSCVLLSVLHSLGTDMADASETRPTVALSAFSLSGPVGIVPTPLTSFPAPGVTIVVGVPTALAGTALAGLACGHRSFPPTGGFAVGPDCSVVSVTGNFATIATNTSGDFAIVPAPVLTTGVPGAGTPTTGANAVSDATSGGGLSTGGLIGIIIALILVLVLGVALYYYFVVMKKKRGGDGDNPPQKLDEYSQSSFEGSEGSDYSDKTTDDDDTSDEETSIETAEDASEDASGDVSEEDTSEETASQSVVLTEELENSSSESIMGVPLQSAEDSVAEDSVSSPIVSSHSSSASVGDVSGADSDSGSASSV
jgi:REJ domain